MTGESGIKVFTWRVHGGYMASLAKVPVTYYVPVGGTYGGRTPPELLPANVIEVDVQAVADLELDCVMYQSFDTYRDGLRLLTDAQRRLPRIYIEHDPPRESPTETHHPTCDDAGMVLVHVTHYNRLMWYSGRARARVIEHGVEVPNPQSYTGELACGIVAVNNLDQRGRRVGVDLYRELVEQYGIPMRLVGMGAERLREVGGYGEVKAPDLPGFMASHRFIFNPPRHTSLSLSLIEGMMVGLPPLGWATTELVKVIQHGKTGFTTCDVGEMAHYMRVLLEEPDLAREIGSNAAKMALDRFGIERFAADWLKTFEEVMQ